jgi:predicted nuclease of restriction endonuclease-like (RecB) superfamily
MTMAKAAYPKRPMSGVSKETRGGSAAGSRLVKRKSAAPSDKVAGALLHELRDMIRSTRQHVARGVNESLVILYWAVGKRIGQDLLHNARAGYGEQTVSALGRQLAAEYGDGFSSKNLWHMVRFAEAFADEEKVSALRRQLTWTHFKRIAYLEDPLKRDFYAEMCRVEQWNTRTLDQKIQSMLFERTALSTKPDDLIRHELGELREADRLTPDLVFRDPYLLGFLGLKDSYLGKDLEAAIMREMERFILELGVGFSFVARQKRITVDNDDYYLDLLFYHRGMRRLVAIELKLGDFKPADKGQMELYLRWLQKNDMQSGEEPPLGLILCAGKKRETVELLELEKSGIRVAAYWLEALPRELLAKKLHDAMVVAKERMVGKEPAGG